MTRQQHTRRRREVVHPGNIRSKTPAGVARRHVETKTAADRSPAVPSHSRAVGDHLSSIRSGFDRLDEASEAIDRLTLESGTPAAKLSPSRGRTDGR
jgi:hypothetical protein